MKKEYESLAKQYQVTAISDTQGTRKCRCGTLYTVKFADLNRGWGVSCSKSCALKGNHRRYPKRMINRIFASWHDDDFEENS